MQEAFPVLLALPPLSLKLETKARRQIPNQVCEERPMPALLASVETWKELRPRAILPSLTMTYNCIGLVVASRRTWVDPSHLLQILKEDGYRRLIDETESREGDVVVYRDMEGTGEVAHVGFVVRKNIVLEAGTDLLVVLSKWGPDGEYEHDSSYVPELFGKPVEYWTDRKGAQP